MPIVKHLNHLVYFIKKKKKKFMGSNSFCKKSRGEFVLAVSFTLLNNINQVFYLSRNSLAGVTKNK